MQRQRYAFQTLLTLVDTSSADVSLEEGESEQLDALRNVPMEEEKLMTWVVQDGEDTSTRQPLPPWLCRPVEKHVTWWAQENQKWQQKIDTRGKAGKMLPPAAQQKYDHFVKEKSAVHMLFCRKTRKQVVKLQSHAELRKREKDLFSIQILMSGDSSKLALKGASGESKRLVLLQCEAVSEESVPDGLAGGVADAAVAALASDDIADDQDDQDDECEEQQGVHEIDEADLQEQEHMEMVEADEASDAEEILYYSSEEETVKKCATHFSRVKTFNHREEWRALEARGGTDIPPGALLGYHATSRTWQGYWEGKSIGLTRTHGGRTNRTAGEALLQVIQGLVERHCNQHPRDKIWAAQQTKLQKISLTIAKL